MADRNKITVEEMGFHLCAISNLKRIYVNTKRAEQTRTKYMTAVKEKIPFSKYFKIRVTVHPEIEDRIGDMFIFFPKSITHDDIIKKIEKMEAFALLLKRDAEKKDTDTTNMP